MEEEGRERKERELPLFSHRIRMEMKPPYNQQLLFEIGLLQGILFAFDFGSYGTAQGLLVALYSEIDHY